MLILTVDNSYTDLFINNSPVALGPGATEWEIPDIYPGDINTVAVRAVNADPGAWAGLLAKISGPGGSSSVSNSTWRATLEPPREDSGGRAWTDPDYDDSAWPLAVSQGAYGVVPWGTIAPALAPLVGAQWIWAGPPSEGASPAFFRWTRKTEPAARNLLADSYALAALSGLLANSNYGAWPAQRIVRRAYQIAYEMLAAALPAERDEP